MKVLALDTGGLTSDGAATVVAIESCGDTVSVLNIQTLSEPRKLGANLALMLEEAREAAFWDSWKEVDGLAIGLGPGSWTSLRVGLATLKTLSQTTGIPLAGIPSFDALASVAHRQLVEQAMKTMGRKRRRETMPTQAQILLTLSPCRPGELYGKIFERSFEYLAPAQREWIADAKGHIDAAFSQALADEIDAPLLLCGPAALDAAQILASRGEEYEVIPVEASEIAISIAISGLVQIAGEETTPLEELAPLYLAPSNAERVREEKLAAAVR